MEIQLEDLTSPAWPKADLPIDWGKARIGARLFKRDCAGCHAPLHGTDLETPIVAEMTPLFGKAGIGTDPWMACNAYTYQAAAGHLTNVPIRILPALSKETVNGKDEVRYLQAQQDTSSFVQAQAVGVLLAQKFRIAWNALRIWTGFPPIITAPPSPRALVVDPKQDKAARLKRCEDDVARPPNPEIERILAYKGRPLNGIWATAPYLHNGSVRTLYQLLLAPKDREDSFYVGSRDFDPVQVGFVNAPGKYGRKIETVDASGNPIDGNSKEGHFYRNYKDDTDRWALVEYMKTL